MSATPAGELSPYYLPRTVCQVCRLTFDLAVDKDVHVTTAHDVRRSSPTYERPLPFLACSTPDCKRNPFVGHRCPDCGVLCVVPTFPTKETP